MSLIGLTKIPRFHHVMKVLITFVLVSFSWIFFRANTLSDAEFIINSIVLDFENIFSLVHHFNYRQLVIMIKGEGGLAVNQSEFLIAIFFLPASLFFIFNFRFSWATFAIFFEKYRVYGLPAYNMLLLKESDWVNIVSYKVRWVDGNKQKQKLVYFITYKCTKSVRFMKSNRTID